MTTAEPSTTISHVSVENPFAGTEQPAYQQPAATSTSSNQQQQQQQQQGSRQFSCLYTKQKTQKRKIWHDGRLILKSCNAVLHFANPAPGSGDPALDQCELTVQQRNDILQQQHYESTLETERFLITVDGPWRAAMPTTAVASTQSAASSAKPATLSNGMKKILTSKYRKPGTFVPPPPMQHQQQPSVLGKRRQPLQPGELQRRHYVQSQQQQHQHSTSAYPQGGPESQRRPYMQQQQHQQQQPYSNYKHAGPSNQISVRPPPSHGHGVPASPPAVGERGYGQVSFRQQQQQQQQQSLHHLSDIHPPEKNPTNASCPVNGYQPPPPPAVAQPARRPEGSPPNNSNNTIHAPFPPSSPGALSTQGMVRPSAQQQQRQQDTSIFAKGNGFDPNSFYGEDEEEDDDDENASDDEGPFQGGIWTKGGMSMPWAAAATTSNLVVVEENGFATNGTSAALSTNELLSLLGAAPPTPNEPAALPPPPPAAFSTDSSHHPVDRGSNSTGADDFVLPPPSDSSSDEESSQEG